jgi:hypothetical protein
MKLHEVCEASFSAQEPRQTPKGPSVMGPQAESSLVVLDGSLDTPELALVELGELDVEGGSQVDIVRGLLSGGEHFRE